MYGPRCVRSSVCACVCIRMNWVWHSRRWIYIELNASSRVSRCTLCAHRIGNFLMHLTVRCCVVVDVVVVVFSRLLTVQNADFQIMLLSLLLHSSHMGMRNAKCIVRLPHTLALTQSHYTCLWVCLVIGLRCKWLTELSKVLTKIPKNRCTQSIESPHPFDNPEFGCTYNAVERATTHQSLWCLIDARHSMICCRGHPWLMAFFFIYFQSADCIASGRILSTIRSGHDRQPWFTILQQ